MRLFGLQFSPEICPEMGLQDQRAARIFSFLRTLHTVLWTSVGKESACNAGDPASIPGSGKSVGEGIGYPLQYSWASLGAQLVKNPPAMWETWVQSWVGKIARRRERLPTPVFWPGEFRGWCSPWGCKSCTRLSRLHFSYCSP